MRYINSFDNALGLRVPELDFDKPGCKIIVSNEDGLVSNVHNSIPIG